MINEVTVRAAVETVIHCQLLTAATLNPHKGVKPCTHHRKVGLITLIIMVFDDLILVRELA